MLAVVRVWSDQPIRIIPDWSPNRLPLVAVRSIYTCGVSSSFFLSVGLLFWVLVIYFAQLFSVGLGFVPFFNSVVPAFGYLPSSRWPIAAVGRPTPVGRSANGRRKKGRVWTVGFSARPFLLSRPQSYPFVQSMPVRGCRRSTHVSRRGLVRCGSCAGLPPVEPPCTCEPAASGGRTRPGGELP